MHNHAIITGRITANPELRQTASGKMTCSFNLAVQRSRSKDSTADFIRIETWGQTAAFVSRYMKKGTLVDVVGAIRTRKWQDKDSKTTRYETFILAENLDFAPTNNRTAKTNTQLSDFGEIIGEQEDL